MQTPEYNSILELYRGDYVDQKFYAIVSLFNNNEETIVLGKHNNYPFFLRSLMKPMQASILADYNVVSEYNFNEPEIAIMQASHAGEKVHIETVLSILEKIGLSEKFLLCPAINPLNSSSLKRFAPRKIHNNCSGKHSMFLSVCKKLNLPYENYNDINHPVQKIVYDKIVELSGFKNPPLSYDGCTLPVFALPFLNIAKVFYKLYTEEKYSFLKTAYMKNPYIIGGLADDGKRLDTEIMYLNPSLISKTGAGGFLSVFNDETKEFLLIKMSQDNNFARRLLALKILEKLKWIEKNPANYNYYDENKRKAGEFFVNGF